MQFKLWLNESNFTQITPEQRKSMDEITKYLKQLYSTGDIDKLKGILKYKDLVVGSVPVGDSGINGYVYVSLTKKPSEAFYSQINNAVVFNVDWLKDNISKDRLARVFAHELGHGLDPKLAARSKWKHSQRYKNYLNRYYSQHEKGVPIFNFEQNPIHHVEPTEQDAEGTAIADKVTRAFLQGHDNEKMYILMDIEKYLKNHRALGSGSVLGDSGHHLGMLKTRPTAFKRFRKRLDSLYRDLYSKLTPEQKQNYYNMKNKPDETEYLD
jgi:hypothetical protein